jgi:hypothetical protein
MLFPKATTTIRINAKTILVSIQGLSLIESKKPFCDLLTDLLECFPDVLELSPLFSDSSMANRKSMYLKTF